MSEPASSEVRPKRRVRLWVVVVIAVLAVLACTTLVVQKLRQQTSLPYELLRRDTIVNADLWDREPRMMAAGLGFTNIIGVPGITAEDPTLSKTLVELAGGTWNTVKCAAGQEPTLSNYTATVESSSLRNAYGQVVFYSDGLPIEFSWPMLASTLDPTDFRVTLNNGSVMTPQVASINPNFEYNERSVAVIFGHFGNRIAPDQPGAIYPTKVEVVADDTPLQLFGPNQQKVSAVGLSANSNGSPYTDPDVAPKDRGGPRLAAAKLSVMSAEGEAAPSVFSQNLPNDGIALYGDKAKYRLRVYTTGGMTVGGVRGVFPTDFARIFRLQAKSSSGATVTLTATGQDYLIDGARVQVVGLADLGKKQDTYDDCYQDDRDNYIDIILDGDRAAVAKITTVEIPSTGSYTPLYNPGGSGNSPAPGVRYSAPSPPISQTVTNALDDPMTVTKN